MSTVAVPPDRSRPLAIPVRSAAPLLLFPYCGFLFFYGIHSGDLYRTEALRAILAQGFLNSGNWVVPTLYGEPLLTKPPGMYAAVALVSGPFGGVTTWSARLPSALAATATVFLFYWYFRRQLGQVGGLAAALILPASFMWLDKASAAEIDMLQVFWVAGGILFFLRALEGEEAARPQAAWWLASLLCVAGGFLTKWTAPAFFYLTVIPLLWWRGRLRLLWGRNHLLSAALGAGLCLGWAALAVSQTGWERFANTVSQEACQRLVPREVPVDPPRHHHRPYPWHETLVHPFVVAAATLPWSIAALFALAPGFARLWDQRQRRLLQALHCWVWPNLLFWTIAPEHAPRHSFPLFPGIAGLAAFVWVGWLTGRLRWPLGRLRPTAVLVGSLALWLVVKLAFVHAVTPARHQDRQPRAKGEQIAALVPRGQPLYLFRLKDEGITFYYSRAHPPDEPDRIVRRLAGPEALPSTGELVYCIVSEAEWRRWESRHPAEVLLELPDQQGDIIFLIRLGTARTDGGP
jgi:4-amino-4-deoxy-L-arabinose transferase-like glycosyltransferase